MVVFLVAATFNITVDHSRDIQFHYSISFLAVLGVELMAGDYVVILLCSPSQTKASIVSVSNCCQFMLSETQCNYKLHRPQS